MRKKYGSEIIFRNHSSTALVILFSFFAIHSSDMSFRSSKAKKSSSVAGIATERFVDVDLKRLMNLFGGKLVIAKNGKENLPGDFRPGKECILHVVPEEDPYLLVSSLSFLTLFL